MHGYIGAYIHDYMYSSYHTCLMDNKKGLHNKASLEQQKTITYKLKIAKIMII